MEDLWGHRRFAHPALAFAAFHDAQKPAELPDDADNLLDLAVGMLQYYYEDWLIEHPEGYETLWVNGVPQVEVEVAIDLTDILREEAEARDPLGLNRYSWLKDLLSANQVHYIMTFDRVVIDLHERIWGLDYKTAAQFDELNLQTNPQAGSYNWGMDLFYTPVGYKPEGIIWEQHKKTYPKEPEELKAGGLSVDKRQATTYRLYKQALVAKFGTVPEKYNDMLSHLAEQQDDDGDQFIRRDLLRRNQYQREVEQGKIVAEVLEMLDLSLIMYPNPTKDCSWDCPFKVPCLLMDDGSDYEYMIESEYEQYAGYKDTWRKRIKWPKAKDTPTLTPIA
jgi:hypothetical protein